MCDLGVDNYIPILYNNIVIKRGKPQEERGNRMKKVLALVLVLSVVFSAVPAFAKTAYDPDKTHLVIVAWDSEDECVYTSVVTYKTAIKRILSGDIYEIYLLEAECLLKLDWGVAENGRAYITNPVTEREILQ